MGDVQRAAAPYRAATAEPVASLPELRRGVADPDELVRQVAAMQLAFHHPADLSESASRELLSSLLRVSRASDESLLTPEYAAASDDGEDRWDFAQQIALALARLLAETADFAVPELVALWQQDRPFYEVALAAVALTFPEGGRPAASALSELQRAVLLALMGDEAVRTFCGDMPPMLGARGLPGTRLGMRSFLASAGGPV
jgi:hypothetical protein